MEGGERGAEHYVACWVAGAREGLLCSVGRDDGRDSIVGTRRLGRRAQKLRYREQWAALRRHLPGAVRHPLPLLPLLLVCRPYRLTMITHT